MADLRSAIDSCLRLKRSLCGLDVGKYLSALSSSDEANFEVFAKFAGACPTPVRGAFSFGTFFNAQKINNNCW